MQITVPKFDFEKLVYSHGWIFLSPFEWDDNSKSLTYTLRFTKNCCLKIKVKAKSIAEKTRIIISHNNHISLKPSHKKTIKKQVTRMLRLDEDFSDFHKVCKDDPLLGFVTKQKCGGILRGANFYEDLIKTVCTTNCDWRNTKRMCIALCNLNGGSFPYPKDILKHSPMILSKKVPLGYRTNTIYQISKLSEEGKLEIDKWAKDGDFERIKKELKLIKGVGDYSVNHMLVLLGNYSNIPVDSEVLKYLRDTHFGGKVVSPKEAVEPYEKYGKYRFLAYKFGRMARKLNYIDK